MTHLIYTKVSWEASCQCIVNVFYKVLSNIFLCKKKLWEVPVMSSSFNIIANAKPVEAKKQASDILSYLTSGKKKQLA